MDPRVLKARKIREGLRRDNPDGTYSTHMMTSFEEDGRHYAIPTLFPGYDTGHDTQEWAELDFKEALTEARKREEMFEFDTAEEADLFARGSWKPLVKHIIDDLNKY